MAVPQAVFRNIPDLVFLLVTLMLHWAVYRLPGSSWRWRILVALSAAYATFSIGLSTYPLVRLLSGTSAVVWLRGLGQLYALAAIGAAVLFLALRRLFLPHADKRCAPERREFVKTMGSAVIAAPAILTGYGAFSGRLEFQVKEVDLAVPGLARDLQGLRILHLSDTHFSPFLTASDLERVVAMSNETRPHLAVFTGDFITGAGDPLEECIRLLGKLRADAPILCCNGNHEVFANCEDAAERLAARQGMRILRQQSQVLRFGDAKLNVTGVDYQQFRKPYLTGMEQQVRPGALNLLLSHNPDVFPVAAAKGFDVTLAGHTHGGQVTVEILNQYANVARFFTPYVSGQYTRGNASLYVTRGIGTVGIPARIGALPEISLIRLCAS